MISLRQLLFTSVATIFSTSVEDDIYLTQLQNVFTITYKNPCNND